MESLIKVQMPSLAGTTAWTMRKTASPAQCRAARALLGWTQAMLAARATVARKTIAEFEVGTRQLRFRTRRDITAALEAGGLVFLGDADGPRAGGSGVWCDAVPEKPEVEPEEE
jgi:DNA-binding XRE family transcriptional regulator